MKKLLTLTLIMGLLLMAGLGAEEQKAPLNENFPTPGVMINRQLVSPGDLMLNLFGIAGLPDHVWANRGQEQSGDYVKMDYLSYGTSFNISSGDKENVVTGILIKSSKLEIQNVPFKVGQSIDQVESAWGKPETQDKKVFCYWKRGVYFITDDQGKINYIFLTLPGKNEEGKDGANS